MTAAASGEGNVVGGDGQRHAQTMSADVTAQAAIPV